MAGYEITAELNLKKIAAEVKEFAKATNEFAKDLEQIEKKYAGVLADSKEWANIPCRNDIPDFYRSEKKETVTEFADRCKECGARYGRLLNQKSDMLDNIKNEITMLHIFNRQNVIEIIDKYKAKEEQE